MAGLASVISYVTAYLGTDGEAAISSFVGAEHLGNNVQAWPAIIWAPTEDEFEEPANRQGSIIAPTALGTRLAGLDVHCFASDAGGAHLAACEAFVHRIVYALLHVLRTDVIIRRGKWMDVDVAQFGRGYVLTCAVKLPIVPTTAGTPDLATDEDSDASSLTGTLDFPSSDVTGSPAP